MLLDRSSEILPGVGAAGFRLGASVAKAELLTPLMSENIGAKVVKLDYGFASIWIEEGTVVQIGVSLGYLGTLPTGIGIGSTVEQIERLYGPVTEDEDLSLTPAGNPGWSFEVDDWVGARTRERVSTAAVSWIFVFVPPN